MALHLNKKQTRFIQVETGMFLFYVCAIDSMMLIAQSAIAMEQANPTTKMLQKTKQFFNYIAMNSDALVTHHASDMLLALHSNAS